MQGCRDPHESRKNLNSIAVALATSHQAAVFNNGEFNRQRTFLLCANR